MKGQRNMQGFVPLDKFRFGRAVVERTFQRPGRNGKRIKLCDCLCDCGTRFTTWAKNLTEETTRSCGCLKAEVSTARLQEIYARRRAATRS